MADSETIWYKDIISFFTKTDTLLEFIPTKSMTQTEQLNAMFRFSLYFGAIVAVIRQDYRIMYFPVIVGVLTYALASNDYLTMSAKKELFDKMELTEDYKRRLCTQPTKNNPYMNVSYVDYTDFPSRPPACDVSRPNVKQRVKEIVDEGMYRNVDDVFQRSASDRIFFTNPSTTIPNDQTAFAEWLYKSGKTNKDKLHQ